MRSFLRSTCVLLVALATSRPIFAADNPELRLITVTGDAQVRVVPDEVILTFGVETRDPSLNKAKSDNDQRAKGILNVADELNVKKKHTQTGQFSIEPIYKEVKDQTLYGRYRTVFIGYIVRKTIVVTLKDTSLFEELLSDALAAGANYVHGVQFRTTELRKYRNQARVVAIKAAKNKAGDLAKELGQKLGKPHTIREDHAGWRSSYNSHWRYGRHGGRSQNVIQNAGGSTETQSAVALGQINVNARVTVIFELE